MTVFNDQTALGFVTSNVTHIEREVLLKEYPEIKYPKLCFPDTSANPFAASVTFFTQDTVGKAQFINGKGNDLPMVNTVRDKFEQTVNEGGMAFSYSTFEIGQAQMAGRNLGTEMAEGVRLVYESFVDDLATLGIGSEKGLYNMSGIADQAAGATFAASTPDAIKKIIDTAIITIESETKGIRRANTIVLPLKTMGSFAARVPDTMMTLKQWVEAGNAYTMQTGQKLLIEFDARLDALNKMVVYRRDPTALKLHMPMPLRFLAPQLRDAEVRIPAVFRVAPLSIRDPKSFLYVTGVSS